MSGSLINKATDGCNSCQGSHGTGLMCMNAAISLMFCVTARWNPQSALAL
jgi:hypothetical protein